MNVKLRALRLSAQLAKTATELFLLVDIDILRAEERDSALGDEDGEVADEGVGVGGLEESGQLESGGRMTDKSYVVVTMLSGKKTYLNAFREVDTDNGSRIGVLVLSRERVRGLKRLGSAGQRVVVESRHVGVLSAGSRSCLSAAMARNCHRSRRLIYMVWRAGIRTNRAIGGL